MNLKSDDIPMMINGEEKRRNVETIEEMCVSLLSRYHIQLDASMKGSDFILNCVGLFDCHCHAINFRRVGSSTDSPDKMKKQEVAINPINE